MLSFLALCGDILLFLVFFFALVLFLTPSLSPWEFEEMRRRVCLYWTSSVWSSPEKLIAFNSQKDPDVGQSTGYNFPFSSTHIKNFFKCSYKHMQKPEKPRNKAVTLNDRGRRKPAIVSVGWPIFIKGTRSGTWHIHRAGAGSLYQQETWERLGVRTVDILPTFCLGLAANHSYVYGLEPSFHTVWEPRHPVLPEPRLKPHWE